MIRIKTVLGISLCMAIIFSSCTRNKEEKKSEGLTIRLGKLTMRGLGDQGDSWEERWQYEYDADGRILRIVDLSTNNSVETFEYSGGELVSIAAHNEDGTVRVRYDRPLRVSASGDTLTLSFIERAGAGYDTAISTHVFRDSLMISTKAYVHFFGQSNTPFQATTFYVHDAQNKLLRAEFEGLGSSGVSWTILESDTKHNVNRVFTREQFVLLSEFQYSAWAANNVTKLREYDGDVVEFEWTYNSAGWPLTCKKKGQPLVEWEWEYSE